MSRVAELSAEEVRMIIAAEIGERDAAIVRYVYLGETGAERLRAELDVIARYRADR
jgi:hypothetical protein